MTDSLNDKFVYFIVCFDFFKIFLCHTKFKGKILFNKH